MQEAPLGCSPGFRMDAWFTGSSTLGTGNRHGGQSARGGGSEADLLEWEQESEEVRSRRETGTGGRVWRSSVLGCVSKMMLRVMGYQHQSLNLAVASSVVCFSEPLATGYRAAISWGLSPEETLLHLNFIYTPFDYKGSFPVVLPCRCYAVKTTGKLCVRYFDGGRGKVQNQLQNLYFREKA